MSEGLMEESDFARLERAAAKPAEALLDGFIIELSYLDTDTLHQVAAYREAIRPNCWMAACIREYLSTWR